MRRLEHRQHFLGVALGLHLWKYVPDLAIRADEEGCSLDPHHLFSIHVFFFQNAVRVADCLVDIGQQRERKVVFVLEFLLFGGSIGGYSQDYGPCILEFCVFIAEPASLYGSTWSVGFWEEVENYVLPAILFKRNGVIVLIMKSELRGLLINLEHGCLHQVQKGGRAKLMMLSQKAKSLKEVAIIAAALISVLGAVLAAQTRTRKDEGPRAVGVVEVMSNGHARVIPVAILVDGQWFDAGVYMASPVPLAVDSQTVYEAEKAGESQGLFTITHSQDLQGRWIGVGVFRPKGSETAKAETSAEKNSTTTSDGDDGPPRLTRGKPSSSSAESTKASTPATASTTPPPPQPQTAPTAPEATAKPGAVPVTKEDKTATAESTPPAEEDPNRPILRRGKPEVEQAEEIPMPEDSADLPVAAGPGVPATAGAKGAPKSGRLTIVKTMAAISDAKGPQPESYIMELRPDERRQYEQTMMQLASAAIRKFSVTHPIRGTQTPNLELTDIQMPVFDINGSNQPVLVMSARAVEAPGPTKPEPRSRAKRTAKEVKPVAESAFPESPTPVPASAFSYYVNVVARVDINGDVRKLFSSVTDSSHLDAIPRLQLIDAVDAEGDKVGDLLFREVFDRSRGYVIYRVGMDQLWQVFEGAQSSFVAGS